MEVIQDGSGIDYICRCSNCKSELLFTQNDIFKTKFFFKLFDRDTIKCSVCGNLIYFYKD
jgi:uncharacterized protein with PIN domain